MDRDALVRMLALGMFAGAAIAGLLADRGRRRPARRSAGPGTDAPSATIAADADTGRQPRSEDPSAPRG